MEEINKNSQSAHINLPNFNLQARRFLVRASQQQTAYSEGLTKEGFKFLPKFIRVAIISSKVYTRSYNLWKRLIKLPQSAYFNLPNFNLQARRFLVRASQQQAAYSEGLTKEGFKSLPKFIRVAIIFGRD